MAKKVKITKTDIAEILLKFRKVHKLTQMDIAKELGISQSNFSKMENAILEPSATQWLHFCQRVLINPDILIHEKNGKYARHAV